MMVIVTIVMAYFLYKEVILQTAASGLRAAADAAEGESKEGYLPGSHSVRFWSQKGHESAEGSSIGKLTYGDYGLASGDVLGRSNPLGNAVDGNAVDGNAVDGHVVEGYGYASIGEHGVEGLEIEGMRLEDTFASVGERDVEGMRLEDTFSGMEHPVYWPIGSVEDTRGSRSSRAARRKVAKLECAEGQSPYYDADKKKWACRGKTDWHGKPVKEGFFY